MSYRAHFSRFFEAAARSPAGDPAATQSVARPPRLHFAAHSHHPWPDVSFAGQVEAWEDAAALADDKWEKIFGVVWPEARVHVARELKLPDPGSLAFGTNTHELLLRLLSCGPERPKILTTDSEFHSFDRQARRLVEAGRAEVVRVPAAPYGSFAERLVAEAARVQPDLIFFSHVFFDAGAVVPELPALVRALPERSTICIDGYHGYCAVPTDLSGVQERAFYLAGSYKYAMGGEGACVLHVPPSFTGAPIDTGWFAAFFALASEQRGVPFGAGGDRFLGSTFDPTALYRLNAVFRWRDATGLSTAVQRAHGSRLAARFVTGLAALPDAPLRPEQLVVPIAAPDRGRFLAFHTPDAARLQRLLHDEAVVTDARGDRLRFGFGVYQEESDVDALLERLGRLR